MKYYLIAGEASGDIHGAALMKALKDKDPEAIFRFWGGDEMVRVSPGLVKHYKDTSFMGFVEVIKNIFTIYQLFKFCKKDIQSFKPDKIIFIDYPGFNLRMAKWAHLKAYETIYYIAPQVWAWKESRVHQIKQFVDKLFVILPFEESFFKERDIVAHYYGHPLKHRIKTFREDQSTKDNNAISENCIACFPGSRKQEIKSHLNYIMHAARQYPDVSFVVAGVRSVDPDIYNLTDVKNVEIVFGQNYQILSRAKVAIITSGTATLEACLFGVPQVVIYKGNAVSYQIAKRIIHLKYISLVNLLADKLVVKELIQNDLSNENLITELNHLLSLNPDDMMFIEYQKINDMLGEGNPNLAIADKIFSDK